MEISIRLSADAEWRLAFVAAKTGRRKSVLLREIIESGLEDAEDYQMAADVMERIRSGREDVLVSKDFWPLDQPER
jgi:RHH-type rel operon transcriptional repressor/antitoxin RelB